MPKLRRNAAISKPAAHLLRLPRLGGTDAAESIAPHRHRVEGLPLIGRCVILKGPVSDCGSYAQPGMMARVLKCRACGEQGAIAVTLDFCEFEAHNRSLEIVAWDDEQLIVHLTAREAGEYRPVEDYFLSGADKLAEVMSPIDELVSAGLCRRFQETGRPIHDYTSWLEELLAEARPDLLEPAPRSGLDI